jgi:hypothetical protein
MKRSKIEQLFTNLNFERDVRFPPDERRCGQFQAGWEDPTTRGKKYSEIVLMILGGALKKIDISVDRLIATVMNNAPSPL